MTTYNVGGFTFTNEAEAKKAKQELQLIEQLKTKTDISKPTIAKQLLANCKAKGAFQTKVGKDFLNKLEQTANNSADDKQLNKSVSNTPANRKVTSVNNKQPNKPVNNPTVNRKVTFTDNKQFNNLINNTPVNRKVTSADTKNKPMNEKTDNQKNSVSKKRIFIIIASAIATSIIIFLVTYYNYLVTEEFADYTVIAEKLAAEKMLDIILSGIMKIICTGGIVLLCVIAGLGLFADDKASESKVRTIFTSALTVAVVVSICVIWDKDMLEWIMEHIIIIGIMSFLGFAMSKIFKNNILGTIGSTIITVSITTLAASFIMMLAMLAVPIIIFLVLAGIIINAIANTKIIGIIHIWHDDDDN